MTITAVILMYTVRSVSGGGKVRRMNSTQDVGLYSEYCEYCREAI